MDGVPASSIYPIKDRNPMNILTRLSFMPLAVTFATAAALAAPALTGAPRAAAQAQSTYTVKNLGVLPGFSNSKGLSVNNRGQVVGWSWNDPTRNAVAVQRAFLWTPGGTAGGKSNPQMQDLGNGNGQNLMAVKINNAGQVIVSGAAPYLWDAANGLRGMNAPSVSNAAALGWTVTNVIGLSDVGQILGVYRVGTAPTRYCLWTPATANAPYGTLSDMGPTAGALSVDTPVHNALNNLGQITGHVRPSGENYYHLFLWNPVDPVTGNFSPNGTTGLYTDLGTLGTGSTYGRGINDGGQIIGRFTSGGITGSFLRDASGSTTVLAGGLTNEALGINNAGAVVGTFGDISSPRAFLWNAAGGMRDLNALTVAGDTAGMTLQEAWGINNVTVNGVSRAQITGLSYVNKQGSRACLLTPR
jgi:probable HAF family extracellular repeat protein